jgi:hypothetical protein
MVATTFDNTQSNHVALRTRLAERTINLVPWIGAGLSAQAGSPTWSQLRVKLLAAFESNYNTLAEPGRKTQLERLQAIRSESNPWVAFDRLKRDNQTSFKDSVREILRPTESATVPEGYSNLWRLRPRGMVTLNLDRLATRSFNVVGGDQPAELHSGRDAGAMMHVLQNPRPFIANLHGVLEDAQTWVFTHSELRSLFADQAYLQFVRTVLTANTVLFVGITADDVAIGSHLDLLKKLGADCGAHFWLTSRRDIETNKWAEARGLRVIRYDDSDGHATPLAEFFEDLLGAVPLEPAELPPAFYVPAVTTPEPTDDLETLRRELNREAQALLKPGTDKAYGDYTRFLTERDEEIYRAWYATDRPPRNILLSLTLLEEVARGAFGRVFRAIDQFGDTLAVKLLRDEHRSSEQMLRAFRRGVRSMRILTDHNLPGMVRFKSASEIPAFVAMEWIEGADLTKAVEAGRVNEWSLLLEIARQLASIVEQAHLLPERVLHRDLRPSNVMLRDFWASPTPSVVVLDFDLSWHKGAIEPSIIQSSAFGYLAPEQLELRSTVSTRHASVDSFGLGMTLFYMAGRRHPIAEQHRHRDWQTDIWAAVGRMGRARFAATPRRYARLIERATRDAQAERWDMGQIVGELEQLRAAEDGKVGSAELAAEALVAGSELLNGYEWDHEEGEARLMSPSGLGVKVRGEERERLVEVDFHWAASGQHERKRLGRWLPDAVRDAVGILTSGGWRATHSVEAQAFQVSARISKDLALSDPSATRASIERARTRLTFDQ